MNEPKKIIAVPDPSAPVVSQALPALADKDAAPATTPPETPIALSQVSSAAWSGTVPLRLS